VTSPAYIAPADIVGPLQGLRTVFALVRVAQVPTRTGAPPANSLEALPHLEADETRDGAVYSRTPVPQSTIG
jgi:hypothetical protein